MPTRAQREAIVQRERALLAQGAMTPEEEQQFDVARAFEMHRAELRRHPELIAPELRLENGQESDHPAAARFQAPQLKRVA